MHGKIDADKAQRLHLKLNEKFYLGNLIKKYIVGSNLPLQAA